MRVAGLFKRLLGLPGVRVVGVRVEERARGGPTLVVDVARPGRRRMACSGCGQVVGAVHDRSVRGWRHRDCLGRRCELRAEVRRLRCPACGVRAEAVPWARPGARFTRAYEDTCAWLVVHAPKSTVAALCGIDWQTVGRIAGRVVAEQRAGADGLDDLRRIGVDEVSHRPGFHYLTVVTCHDSGRVVWVGAGRRSTSLHRFFDALGPERAGHIEAVSADLGVAYLAVIRARAPQAAICADPFHLVAMAQFALDRVRATRWQELRHQDPERARWLKGTRFALRRGPARRSAADRALIDELERANREVYRAFLWVEQLRALLGGGVEPGQVAALLEQLAGEAPSLGHPRFTRLAGTLRAHATAILNTVRLRLSNGRIEAMNSTVRLISHRSRGFRRLDNLIALIHLVCGRVGSLFPRECTKSPNWRVDERGPRAAGPSRRAPPAGASPGRRW